MNAFIKLLFLAGSMASLSSCCQTSIRENITTTETVSWSHDMSGLKTDGKCSVNIVTGETGQVIDGFGACFNELGWDALSLLTEQERNLIFDELFAVDGGANFNICRMPVAANDFSRDWYSYNETDGDFEMKNFSVANDYQTLIPFIKKALSVREDLKIWASPWCPPTWMKYNRHYAMKYTGEETPEQYRNGLPADKTGKEGSDMFIAKPEYMKAYALYFRKFIEAYRAEGIDIFAVMPQNEFNSDQIFPSCCWKASTLAEFVGKYLGPEMESCGTEVMFGTMERANAALVDTILCDPDASKYVKAVGFQWAGKDAVAPVHAKYPDMKLYQTEQECGDGQNSWGGVTHSWNLMKHYFDNGISAYMYWNIALKQGGISRWGWAQNSLIVVDGNKYRFTNEYYLLKHASHFVKPGARYLKSTSEGIESLAFINPDNSVVIMSFNKSDKNLDCKVIVDGKEYRNTIAGNSINTIVIG